MKNKLSGHIKSVSIQFIYFQSHYGSFYQHFWRNVLFCSNTGPLPNVTFSAVYFKHSLLNWRFKFMEMTECLQNCRFLLNNYLILLKRRKIKMNWKIIDMSRLFCSWLTLRKRHILRLRPLAIPLLTKTLIIYSKMINIYYNLLCCLEIWCFRNIQIFIDLPFRGYNFIKIQSTNFLITPRTCSKAFS